MNGTMVFIKNAMIFVLLLHVANCLRKDAGHGSSINVIRVKQNPSEKHCVVDKKGTSCPDLTLALMQKDLNDTRIEILEPQKLTSIAPLVNVHNLEIIGNSFVCNCTKSNIGFSFVNSSNITFSAIIITKCGRKFLSSASPPEGTNSTPYISTALYFNRTTNVSLLTTTISESMGYAVTMYDCDGHLEFYISTFCENHLVPFVVANNSETIVYNGYSSGGGVYIEYTSHVDEEVSSNNSINFDSCIFQFNVAEKHTSILSDGRNHVPFGRGAGISIFFLGFADHNHVIIDGALIEKNTALWGAGLHIDFGYSANNNHVEVIGDSLFGNNHADYSGGGIRIVNGKEDSMLQVNKVKFVGALFTQNSAKVGGGFSQYRGVFMSVDTTANTNETIFINCTFYQNRAQLGSAAYLDETSASFSDLTLDQNNIPDREQVKTTTNIGVMYAYRSSITIRDNNNVVSDNYNTAVILDYSIMYVLGTLIFAANKGENGGAIALFQHSKLVLTNLTNLTLIRNSANKGGAIFVKVPGPPMDLWNTPHLAIYDCFFSFEEGTSASDFNGNVTFIDNVASRGDGNAIFATTLQNCVQGEWRNFNFAKQQSITTDPIKLIIPKEPWNKIWPGKIFSPIIQLIDERNNSVSDTVDISVEPKDIISLINNMTRFVVTKEQINLEIFAKEQIQRFNITVSSSAGKVVKKLSNIILDNCPFGYFFQKSGACICSQKKNLDRGISQCLGERIYLFKNMWAKPDQFAEKHDKEKILYCPAGYCSDNCTTPSDSVNRRECLYEKFNQCDDTRDQNSTLCGKCKEPYSVAFGSEKCLDCREKWWFVYWLIPVMIIVFAGIVLVILWSNFDIYDNYLNVVFYFYQVAHLLKTPTQKYDPAMDFLVGVVNLDGLHIKSLHGLCVWNGFNDMYKYAFNYLIPCIMLMVLAMITIIGRCCRNFYFNRAKCFRAFVFVMTLAYGDFTRITFTLLHGGVVDTSADSKRLYIYGDVEYLHGEHLYIGVFAFFVLVVVVAGFPLLLIMSNFILSFHLVKFKPIFDSFNYCFKETKISQFFASYYFICRLIMLAVALFTQKDQQQLTNLTVICILVFAVFAFSLPYKKNRMNNFDIFVLFNLAAIAVLSNGKRKLYTLDPSDDVFFNVINVLMWPPLVLFLLFLLWKKLRKCFPEEKRPALLEACVHTEDEDECHDG